LDLRVGSEMISSSEPDAVSSWTSASALSFALEARVLGGDDGGSTDEDGWSWCFLALVLNALVACRRPRPPILARLGADSGSSSSSVFLPAACFDLD
jgi:hypothetical protein